MPRRGARLIYVLLLGLCLCVVGQRGDLEYDSLVVFGDSMSDDATHGAWQLSTGTWPSDSAYSEHKFTNGPVWAEYVAQHFQLKLEDYACGGATSDNDLVPGKTCELALNLKSVVENEPYSGPDGSLTSPAMVDQVDEYIRQHAGTKHAHRTLFAILVGANDVYFKPEVNAWQVVDKIDVVIQRLRPHGAFSFLLGVPSSLALSPYATSTVAPNAERMKRFEVYASELRRDLTRLRIRLSSREYRLQVAILDLYALFHHVVARPESYGLDASVIKEPCLTGTYGDSTPRRLCQDVDKYLFWDLFHPTRAAHQIIAKDAQSAMLRHFGRRIP